MNWGKLGTIGGLFLAAYLLVVGIGALVGGSAILRLSLHSTNGDLK